MFLFSFSFSTVDFKRVIDIVLPLLLLAVQAPHPDPERAPPTATREKHLNRIANVQCAYGGK